MTEDRTDPARILFELAPRLTRLENAVLGDMEPPLTWRQYRMLVRVSHGYTSLTALGKTATISLAAVSECVDRLVERGLLRREKDPADRRATLLTVTDRGRRALREAEGLLGELSGDVLGELGPQDRARLAAVLRSVEDRVRSRLPR
ncbi:MAG: winged helix DNA-binding protein [Streptosporangiales bacterium]|nr:winged helix DNA-binding protein [Streptosporangiales bacterium]